MANRSRQDPVTPTRYCGNQASGLDMSPNLNPMAGYFRPRDPSPLACAGNGNFAASTAVTDLSTERNLEDLRPIMERVNDLSRNVNDIRNILLRMNPQPSRNSPTMVELMQSLNRLCATTDETKDGDLSKDTNFSSTPTKDTGHNNGKDLFSTGKADQLPVTNNNINATPLEIEESSAISDTSTAVSSRDIHPGSQVEEHSPVGKISARQTTEKPTRRSRPRLADAAIRNLVADISESAGPRPISQSRLRRITAIRNAEEPTIDKNKPSRDTSPSKSTPPHLRRRVGAIGTMQQHEYRTSEHSTTTNGEGTGKKEVLLEKYTAMTNKGPTEKNLVAKTPVTRIKEDAPPLVSGPAVTGGKQCVKSPQDTSTQELFAHNKEVWGKHYHEPALSKAITNIQGMITQRPWRPLAVRGMAPLSGEIVSKIPPLSSMATFSWDFIKTLLGGVEWSPGLHFIPYKQKVSILPSRTYYMFDTSVNPFLPSQPGEHGATLTPFFHNIENEDDVDPYSEVPMFVCLSPKGEGSGKKNAFEYVYFGTYSQTRWSDRLDYERIVEQVPVAVKAYWAERLSEIGRPQWITDSLKEHFWPSPAYMGSVPPSSSSSEEDASNNRSSVYRDIEKYVHELKECERERCIKVGLLKKETILKAFENPDADEPSGLRLWWEYLECVDWDQGFYNMLVKQQESSPHKRSNHTSRD